MANISTWTTSAASNNSVSPDGFPEGMAPSGVNDAAREVMAAVRRWYVDAEWINHGFTWVRQSNNSFLVSGTATDIFTARRRLRMIDGGVTIYGDVIASSPSGANTLVTVSASNLSSSLSSGAVGILNPFVPSNNLAFPAMWIQGLVPSNNTGDATNDIDISAGQCRDATNVHDILLSAMTKQSDAAWAVGSNQGGLDTGAVGNNDYFIFAIKRADTGVTDVLFSLSLTGPTMPANYGFKRLIGWFRRTGGTIVAFAARETAGGGLKYLWDDPPLDVDVTEDTTANIRTLSAPVGIPVEVTINAVCTNAGSDAKVYISSPDANDEAASGTASPLASILSTTSIVLGGQCKVDTNTSAQIRTVAAAASTTLRISTLGWEWGRR